MRLLLLLLAVPCSALTARAPMLSAARPAAGPPVSAVGTVSLLRTMPPSIGMIALNYLSAPGAEPASLGEAAVEPVSAEAYAERLREFQERAAKGELEGGDRAQRLEHIRREFSPLMPAGSRTLFEAAFAAARSEWARAAHEKAMASAEDKARRLGAAAASAPASDEGAVEAAPGEEPPCEGIGCDPKGRAQAVFARLEELKAAPEGVKITKSFESQVQRKVDGSERAVKAVLEIGGREYLFGFRSSKRGVSYSLESTSLDRPTELLSAFLSPDGQRRAYSSEGLDYGASTKPSALNNAAAQLFTALRQRVLRENGPAAESAAPTPAKRPTPIITAELTAPTGYETKIKAGEFDVLADEPVAVGGTNKAPSPMMLLFAALAACTTMTLRMYALRKGIALPSLKVNIGLIGSPHGKFTIRREIELSAPVDPALEAKILEIAEKCPVHKALASPVETVVRQPNAGS